MIIKVVKKWIAKNEQKRREKEEQNLTSHKEETHPAKTIHHYDLKDTRTQPLKSVKSLLGRIDFAHIF